MPSRKSTKAGSAANTPASCVMRLAGPALVLRGEMNTYVTHCQPSGSPYLAPTGGRRTGHVAALSPENRNVIVVAGGLVFEDAAVAEDDLFADTMLLTAGCEGSEAKRLQTSSEDDDGGHGSSRQGLTPCEQPLCAEEAASAGQKTHTNNLSLAGTAVDVPAAWRTPFPFMECYDIERGEWFVPADQARRSEAIGGGTIRWPTQAAAMLQWWGEAPSAAARPARSAVVRPATAAPPAKECATAEEKEVTAAAAPSVPKAAAEAREGPAAKKKRKPSPSMFDRLTYDRPTREPRQRSRADDASEAARTSLGGADEGNSVYKPVGLNMGVAGDSAAAATTDALARSTDAMRGLTAPLALLPSPTPSLSARPPASVLLFGGWDGAARLSTVMAYYTGELPADATVADIATSYTLPAVSNLPTFPPVSHQSATNVRGSVYCFGGDTLTGCSGEVRILSHPKLRHAYRKECEAQLLRQQQQERRLRRNSGANLASTRSFVLSSSTPSVSHKNEELQRMMLLSRTQETTESANDEESCDAHGEGEDERGVVDWSCLAVTWPPAPPASTSAPTTPVSGAADGSLEASAGAAAARKVDVPAPAGRSSHVAECLGNRYLVIFGGRQLVLPVDANAATDGKGKGAKSTAKRPVSHGGPAAGAAGKKKPGKGGAAPSASAWEADENALPKLSLLSDVAVFDTKERLWLQVTITGGEAPEARYGAAVCALPSGNVSAGATELLVHGGTGEDGRVLADAWVLTGAAPSSGEAGAGAAVGGKRRGQGTAAGETVRPPTSNEPKSGGPGSQSFTVETDPQTGALSVALRWLRVDVSSNAANSPVDDNPSEKAPALPVSALARTHHALVATPQREVFIIGGRSPEDCTPTLKREGVEADQAAGTVNGKGVAPTDSGLAPPSSSSYICSITVPPLAKLVKAPVSQLASRDGRSVSKAK